MLYLKGVTTDEQQVVAGVFRLYETEGLPLEVIFQALMDRDCIPCWISFYRECFHAKMKHNHILSKLEPAIADSYGSEMAAEVIRTLNRLYLKT